MTIPKYDPKELEVVSETPQPKGQPTIKDYSYPVSPREAYIGALTGHPVWQIIGTETRLLMPRIIPDNVARAMVFEAKPFDRLTQGGGKDMFGIEWEYVAVVDGSMVRPGTPLLEDANEWREKIVWPDIDSWDWEGSAEENSESYYSTDQFKVVMFLNGWFERLISFMDFEGAVIALFDEDQQDAVKELFDRLTDLYIRIFDKYLTYFPQVDCFEIHDDWGSSQNTFFSPAIAEEMIVPFMKRVTDYLHSRGKYCLLHSCGQLMQQVPNIIAAGWDSWNPQPLNDIGAIYENYGDKLVIAAMSDKIDAASTEEEQRTAARAYAERYCNPSKPTLFNMYGKMALQPFFREELYVQSRLRYDA